MPGVPPVEKVASRNKEFFTLREYAGLESGGLQGSLVAPWDFGKQKKRAKASACADRKSNRGNARRFLMLG
jgi:hypothetical protein